MRFFLFLVSYAFNPLIIYAVPSSQTVDFLFLYTIYSAVFSLLTLAIFSCLSCLSSLEKYIKIITLFLLIIVPFSSDYIVWAIYVLSILFGDYLATQKGGVRASNFFRVLLIVTSLPFVLFEGYFRELLIYRAEFILVFILIVSLFSNEIKVLSVKYPRKWIITTYVSYSGALFLIPVIGGSEEVLKFWYIGSQIGIGLVLKKLDFSIRSIKKDSSILFNAINVIITIIPLLLMILYPSVVFLTIYVVSILALRNLKNEKA